MSNINRDYLIILDVKSGEVDSPNIYYFNTDKNTSNLYVQMVIKETSIEATPIDNATNYSIKANILKPNMVGKIVEGDLVNEAKAIYEFKLPADCTDFSGNAKIEFEVYTGDKIATSFATKFKVNGSILTEQNKYIKDSSDYPILKELMAEVVEINKTANELDTTIRTLQADMIEANEEMKTNEATRQANETTRVANEAARKEAERTRVNQEVAREQAEADREVNEQQRTANENDRIYKENRRESQERDRVSNEYDRENNEQDREYAENARREAEAARSVAESTRVTAENNRVTAENNRETQETLRQEAEADRVTAEQAREASNTAMRQDITNMQDEISNFKSDVNNDIDEIRTATGQEIDTIKVIVENQNTKIDYIKENDRKQDILINGIFNSQDNKLTSTLESNVHSLVESKPGLLYVDEIVGNTMVNCNKEADKSIVLSGAINEEGTNNITLTQGADGAKADVYVEGNTMVNVCHQEEAVAITKSYTVETGNHVLLEGDYDGKCRPVVYGNTLVNLVQNASNVEIRPDLFGTIILNLSRIKTNTLYTVVIRVKNNTLDKPIKLSGWSLYNGYNTDNQIHYYHEPMSSVNALDRRCFNASQVGEYRTLIGMSSMTEGKTSNIVLFTDSGATGSAIFECLLLEGDYTNKPIPDYFTGMQSSFEDKVVTQEMVDSGKELAENLGKYKVEYKVTGKNKIDTAKYFDCDYGSKAICIKAKANTTYTYSSTCEDAVCFALYKQYSTSTPQADNNKSNVIFVKPDARSGFSYTTPNYDCYIWMNLSGTDDNQLEEGSTATAYEPYKEHIKTYYLNSPLLEGDTIEESNGNVYHVHRYKKIVLDGSSDETWYIAEQENTYRGAFENIGGNPNKNTCICAIFKNKNYWDEDVEGIWVDRNLILSLSKSKINSTYEFTSYLQTNPVTAVYQLASPQYELISQSDTILTDSYVSGHLDFDTVVPIEKVQFKENFNTACKYIYASTEYIIQFESDNNGKLDKLHLAGSNSNTNVNVVKGINKFRHTTDSTLGSKSVFITGIGFNASNIVVTEAVEGDFGYFKGMKSVGEQEGNKIEILSKGKLPNYTVNLEYGNRVNYNFDSNLSAQTIKNISDKNIAILIFDSNGNWLRDGGLLPNHTYTVLDSEVVNIITLYTIEGWEYKEYDLNKIIEITPYQQSNKKEILSDPLRKVGDIADRYVLIDGKWYIERNCKKVTFNGSEIWNAEGYGGHATRNTFEIAINNMHTENRILKSICDTYIASEIEDIPTKDNTYRIYNSISGNVSTAFVLFTPSTSIIPYRDINAWKEWLRVNPITIIVECSPTYEPIDYNPLDIYSDTTHISINSNIPAKIKARNHGYNCMVKPSTTYTATYNIDGTPQKTTIVTPATLDDATRFTGTGTLDNFLLLEGDISNPPAFFAGMRSCFDQEYDEVKGKWKVNIRVEGNDTYNDITIYINEPLREGDIIRAENRKILVERHMREVVFDGSEDEGWRYIADYGTVSRFDISVDNLLPGSRLNILCDNFTNIPIATVNKEAIGVHGSNNYLQIQTFNAHSYGNFKQYLSQNPVTVVYKLASPIYEEVETDYTRLMLESYENATVYFNSHIFPTSTIRYQANVISTSEIMSVSDQQDMLLIDSATEIAVIKLTM